MCGCRGISQFESFYWFCSRLFLKLTFIQTFKHWIETTFKHKCKRIEHNFEILSPLFPIMLFYILKMKCLFASTFHPLTFFRHIDIDKEHLRKPLYFQLSKIFHLSEHVFSYIPIQSSSPYFFILLNTFRWSLGFKFKSVSEKKDPFGEWFFSFKRFRIYYYYCTLVNISEPQLNVREIWMLHLCIK